MLRLSIDSKNSGDYNWHRLWESPSKKSQRRYTRAWLHPLPGDLLISEALAIPKHPIGPSNKRSRPGRWPEQANRLREANELLRTLLEASRAEQPREPPSPFPPSRPGKGKKVAASDEIDLQVDDELSYGSSPLPRRSPSPNVVEA